MVDASDRGASVVDDGDTTGSCEEFNAGNFGTPLNSFGLTSQAEIDACRADLLAAWGAPCP